ncbi:hypothetical protein [Rhodoferax sp.]|uniref:c-type cytochrome n=1 Tax=Rhodoferax sp. TaxID=50421 RepID=UPI00262CB301|nr:hypothetical protein [Rhodoferax sp.]MDD2918989.1 hypothetical protein [Rhodoferax sp.]
MNNFFACLGVGALALTGAAHASPQLAIDHGCYSCHGAYPRGEAPNFESLASKLGKYRGDADAVAKFVTKYRTGEPLEHIDAHERLSAETATTLVHWLAEGGK